MILAYCGDVPLALLSEGYPSGLTVGHTDTGVGEDNGLSLGTNQECQMPAEEGDG